MKVTHFSCGVASNESELKALNVLKYYLESTQGNGEWVLLTNLAFSFNNQHQSDEIDIIAIGPPGVRVIEVKHWTAKWVKSHEDTVNHAADLVTSKARRVGTTLRKFVQDLRFVEGAFLLTQDSSSVEKLSGEKRKGVRFYTLGDRKEVLGLDSEHVLSNQQVQVLSHELEPKSQVAMEGSLRRFAGYINLELQTPRDQGFHRIYKGKHATRQDRVVLHLYDLSVSGERNLNARARREFDALHRLQMYAWAPRILDSYQDAPGYSGEMFFFTMLDPAAPSMETRAKDAKWNATQRTNFARNSMHALRKMHEAGSGDEHIVHRNLTTETILVRHDNLPILTGFSEARISMEMSIASAALPTGDPDPAVAPEIREEGLGAADRRSDVYSLCACLTTLFEGGEDENSLRARRILAEGLHKDPDRRGDLEEMENSLAELLGESVPTPPLPAARFWTEDQVVRFGNRDYRIVLCLGSGGVGTAFKVVEIDRKTHEDLGTYVAKVAHDKEAGKRVLRSYSQARSHLGRHSQLSAIFEVASEWRDNSFVALMTWIEGSALRDFAGVLPLLAEEQGESSDEALAVRWLRVMCEALDVLHRKKLVHGDVSPRNMIVSEGDIVLTDYDFVTRIGDPTTVTGTTLYRPSIDEDGRVSASDDIYALAASFFHVMFDREPFMYNGTVDKRRGLNWEGIDRDGYPVLADFMDRATHPNPDRRFSSSAEAVTSLEPQPAKGSSVPDSVSEPGTLSVPALTPEVQPELGRNEVEWLRYLLQSYPGSMSGNSETRGLDTDFASDTYVATALEKELLEDIRNRKAKLVVLCGNAGDGKTALLQSLAEKLDLGRQESSERILEGKTKDGMVVRMNLDGSAAWKEKSADEILNEFLEPFLQGPPDKNIVHLLAINDGRLLEWIGSAGESSLADSLDDLLAGETDRESHIRFVDLNQRPLVGAVDFERNILETGFLETLMNKLYGGEKAAEIWAPCRTCLAQEHCEVFRAMRFFGPDGIPSAESPEVRLRARQRLFEVLQAVHFLGETHITVRELRTALVYILFGTNFCSDYHDGPDETVWPYWDRAFSPDSPRRQGELLLELARFDPALESHPKIDRRLAGELSGESGEDSSARRELSLGSARRKAYFEWSERKIEEIGSEKNALGLAHGTHLDDFRNLPLKNVKEREELCARLCRGISHLEDLPPEALKREDVPLRITPRTPTDTAFWVEKPLSFFSLDMVPDPSKAGNTSNRLHRQAVLVYQYRDGREERLHLGLELFHLLLELSDGYQLGDVSTDDTFAHLSIFVQRLVSENERELFAWNPMQEENIYRITAEVTSASGETLQQTRISRMERT